MPWRPSKPSLSITEFTNTNIYIYTYIYIYISIYIYSQYINICMYLYIYIYIFIFICYVHIHIYIVIYPYYVHIISRSILYIYICLSLGLSVSPLLSTSISLSSIHTGQPFFVMSHSGIKDAPHSFQDIALFGSQKGPLSGSDRMGGLYQQWMVAKSQSAVGMPRFLRNTVHGITAG